MNLRPSATYCNHYAYVPLKGTVTMECMKDSEVHGVMIRPSIISDLIFIIKHYKDMDSILHKQRIKTRAVEEPRTRRTHIAYIDDNSPITRPSRVSSSPQLHVLWRTQENIKNNQKWNFSH